MENHTKVIPPTQFKIKQHPDRLGADCFHYSASHPDFKFHGFGSAYDQELALKIAISECLEREHFNFYSKQVGASTTSGFAVHVSNEQAEESAINECLERDAILTSWLTHTAPRWLTESEWPEECLKLRAPFAAKKMKISVGITAISNNRYCLVSALTDDKREFAVFSGACNRSLKNAILSTVLELRRAATVIVNQKVVSNFKDDKTINEHGATKHFNEYRNQEKLKNIEWFFDSNGEGLGSNTFEVKVLNLPVQVQSGWELHLAYASSVETQGFYFGSPRFNIMNRKRLRPFFNLGTKFNKQLHVLP